MIQTQHFPHWKFDDETYLLACLLHDIGTTDKNLNATMMSFEFYGGFLALELLTKDRQAPKAQAESVTEAIIRHQDLGESGKITALGGLLQLATVFGASHNSLWIILLNFLSSFSYHGRCAFLRLQDRRSGCWMR